MTSEHFHKLDALIASDKLNTTSSSDSHFFSPVSHDTIDSFSDDLREAKVSQPLRLAGITSRPLDNINNDDNTKSGIIGGNNNSIREDDHFTTLILGCSNITTEDNNNLAIVAMKGQESDGVFTGFEEALITRNLYALSHAHIGPIMKEQYEDVVLSTNGNIVINGTLFAKHIADEELFLEGNNTYNLLPESGYNIVYINSVNGPVNIILGTITNNKFERNRRIVFKDVSLETCNDGAMYNINIIVPYRSSMTDAPRIEYYNSFGLTVGCNAGYSINTNGGSVVLRYHTPLNNTGAATWLIESQFLGNPRISHSNNLLKADK